MSMRIARLLAGVLVAGVTLGLGIIPSAAQGAEVLDAPQFDPRNPAYAVYAGSGVYLADGRVVWLLRIDPKIPLLSPEDRKVGLRLRLNATFGFYLLESGDVPGTLDANVSTAAFVPGLGFPVMVKTNWMLEPFLDFGVSVGTEADDTILVHGIGLRSRAEFHDDKFDYTLWNEAIAAGNSDTNFDSIDNYGVFRTDLEVRGLIRYKVGKRWFDLGLLTKFDWYFDPVIVEPGMGDTNEINQMYQIGLTTGPTERWKLFKVFTTPRVGLAYYFGDASGIRIIFRFLN